MFAVAEVRELGNMFIITISIYVNLNVFKSTVQRPLYQTLSYEYIYRFLPDKDVYVRAFPNSLSALHE